VAAFGVTAVSDFLVGERVWLGLLGGVFLCYLGIRTFLSSPPQEASPVRRGGLLAAFASTFFLTLTNPTTILSFVAVFAGFGLGGATNYFAAAILVAGVFLGSAFWWLLLSNGVALFRSAPRAEFMRAVNRLSGGVILALGLYALSISLPK